MRVARKLRTRYPYFPIGRVIEKFSTKHCEAGTASYIFTKVPRNFLKKRALYGIICISSGNEGEPYG